MQCLRDRKTTREYSPEDVPLPVLSNLLWAADGVNRPESGHRTIPYTHKYRNISIYIAMDGGTYVFDPNTHMLNKVLEEDLRPIAGVQKTAARPIGMPPINLIYAADLGMIKLRPTSPKELRHYVSFTHTALMVQNVYLFCASEGLGTIVRLTFDRPLLEKKLGLDSEHYVTLVQSVGYLKR